MFGIKEKALFLYLAVSFVLYDKANSTGPWPTDNGRPRNKTFHCVFEDRKYRGGGQLHWNNVEEGYYGFTDISKWDIFKNILTKAFTEVIENNPLNNVDQFISFIQAYKKHGYNKTLESFFTGIYEVPFEPLQDPVSFLIEINRRMVESDPTMENSMYIISAYVDSPKKMIEELKYVHLHKLFMEDKTSLPLAKQLTERRFQRHVAGVIQVSIGDDLNKGIILLEPGYMNGDKRVNPYAVLLMEMEDDKNRHLHGARLYGNPGGVIKHSMGNFFALSFGQLTKQNKGNVLYYRRKPFCSFMESTTKGNLLALNHGILSFGPNGLPKGYLTFKIDPENPSFNLGFFDTEEDIQTRTWKFDSIKKFNTDKTIGDEINNYARLHLNLGETGLLSKLQTIQSEVYEDSSLVKEIVDLTNKFNPKKNVLMSTISTMNNITKQAIVNLFQDCIGGIK